MTPSKQKTSTIILVVGQFPQLSETFIVRKFLGLLDTQWDAHIVCREFRKDNWKRYEVLSARPDLRKRIHVTPPLQPFFLSFAFVLSELARCLTCAPTQVLRYFVSGTKKWGLRVGKNFYLDSSILWLQPAVVHYEFGTLAVERLGVKEVLRCKIVVSFRGYDLNYVGLDREPYYQDVWDGADVVHFLGTDLRNRAIRRGCPPSKPYVLIPPAVKAEDYQRGWSRSSPRAQQGQEPFRILSVGRLEWKKGYEFALESVRKLVEKGVRCDYTIVGEGSYLECIAFARYQLALEGMVNLVGSVDPSKIKEYLAEADVFLHAAVSEGFCNAVLEAQAMGVPIVCTDADGLRENVVDGETGFVVPRRNSDSMAEKLMVLAQNPALRRRLGHSGRQRIKNLFTLEKQVAAFGKLYDSLCDPPRRIRGEPAL